MQITLVGHKKENKSDHALAHVEEEELIEFLRGKDLEVESTVWNDKSVDWTKFDLIIINSTWDYHNHLPEFLSWLDTLESLNLHILNKPELIKWNCNKRYLQEIGNRGLPIISSVYINKGELITDEYFSDLQSDKLVLKPCVSAGAQHTFVLNKDNFQSLSIEINSLLKGEDFIIQPFIKEIQDGEYSFIFFNGRFSHCVLKTPKKGDFRVQSDHGGMVSSPAVNPEHVEQAAAYLSVLPVTPLYARVDGILFNEVFHLMELELIEPYLFFTGNKEYMENYYRAIKEQLA